MKKLERKIITIDEKLCNGCGNCIAACPEQAVRIVQTSNGPKARLVKEIYCDGLGACLGTCPTGALTIEERKATAYDEEATIDRIREAAPEMMDTHLKHLEEHAPGLSRHHPHESIRGLTSCPSAQTISWAERKQEHGKKAKTQSELRQWPIQLHLVSPSAPYFKDSDLLIVADCVPFAYPDFHQDFLKEKAIVMGCPKLDDVDAYLEKIRAIVETANPKSIEIVHMEVPCCFSLVQMVKQVLAKTGKEIPVKTVKISIKGKKL
ncbi:MAG TPA: 4Fe-4S dicluster domain-containing protein [Candidatus Bathyarchaeia archaeon]|nr:4Fe-4S dicluster domain-containing protein [Candidatus Bathyarchaeia archaeon]